MSCPFVREDDNKSPAPSEPVPGAAPNLVTPRGARLIGERIAAIEAALAAAEGEDAERLRRDLGYWMMRRATAHLVPTDPHPPAVGFGTRVTIRRGILMSDVWIVGEDEADTTGRRISWTAPLARALEGAAKGDVIELEDGGRAEEVRVLAVHRGDD